MNNEEKILQMLGEMKINYERLNQTVAKIENEHGKKIDLILENQVDNNRNIEDLQQRMDRVEDKLDNAMVIKAVK